MREHTSIGAHDLNDSETMAPGPDRFWLCTAFIAGGFSGFAASATSLGWSVELLGSDVISVIAMLGVMLGLLCLLERMPRLTVAGAAAIMIAVGMSLTTVKLLNDHDAASTSYPRPNLERTVPHRLAPNTG